MMTMSLEIRAALTGELSSTVLTCSQFWLFAIYDKDEMTDLTKDQKAALKTKLEIEVRACD